MSKGCETKNSLGIARRMNPNCSEATPAHLKRITQLLLLINGTAGDLSSPRQASRFFFFPKYLGLEACVTTLVFVLHIIS